MPSRRSPALRQDDAGCGCVIRDLDLGGATIRFEFDNDGAAGKGGRGALYVNNRKVGEGRIDRTQPAVFSAEETADVGIDLATPVARGIGAERASDSRGDEVSRLG